MTSAERVIQNIAKKLEQSGCSKGGFVDERLGSAHQQV